MSTSLARSLSRSAPLGGASAVELAIILAAFLGTLLLAVEVIGLSTRNVYESLAIAEFFHGQQLRASRPQATEAAAGPDPVQGDPTRLAVPGTAVALLGTSLWLLRRRRRALRLVEPALAQEATILPDRRELFDRRQQILKVLTADWRGLFHDRVIVGQVMSKRFRTVEPATPVEQIRQIFREELVTCVVVCDHNGALQGVIGHRELAEGSGAVAKQIMVQHPQTVASKGPLSPAITALLERGAPCLAVVEEGRVLGILSCSDVMLAFQCALRLLHRIVAGHDIAALDDQWATHQRISGHLRPEDAHSGEPTDAIP